MKIIHFLKDVRLADGGVVRAMLDMCELLARAGDDVRIAACDAQDVPEEWRGDKAGVPRLVELSRPRWPLGLLDPSAIAALRPVVQDADVVHLHTPWDVANLQVAKLASAAGVPYVLTVHGMLDDWSMAQRGVKKRLYLVLAGRRLLESARFVHCTAEAELTQASRWFPRGASRVIPCIFDLTPYRALPGPDAARRRWPVLAGEGPVILFLSRLHYKKGPDVLIDTAAALRDQGFAFHLMLAGTGDYDYLSQLRKRAERAGLALQTTFAGLVVGDEKLSLYQAADVFVLPTSQENFGIVFPEALATRTPVVTTRGVDIWPELEKSGGAAIVDRDPTALAECIGALLTDSARRETMGEAGCAWVFETFADERLVGRYRSMYEDARSG